MFCWASYFYQLCRRSAGRARRFFRRQLARELPPGVDIDVHFKPRYQPWDQRVCLVPDADLFRAIRAGRASVVTDQIVKFTQQGILLQSGQELPADIIVTATGLKLLACGGIRLAVDGTPVDRGAVPELQGVDAQRRSQLCPLRRLYQRFMDIARGAVVRVRLSAAQYMDRHGYSQCVPRCDPAGDRARPLLGLTSGYVQRAPTCFPNRVRKRRGSCTRTIYCDLLSLRFGKVNDGNLVFS